MTAIIAIGRKESLEFYSDGAAYDVRGNLLFIKQKVDILLHQPALLASRGEKHIGDLLKFICSHEPSFDLLVQNIGKHLLQATKICHEWCRNDINCCAIFGGWSERSRSFELYRIFIGGKSLDDLEAGSLELKQVMYQIEPQVPREILEEKGILKDGALDFSDGDSNVIRYMECQREQKYEFGRPDGDYNGKGCIVGGFIQKTVLMRDAATTKIIHRWNDEVGKPLGFRDREVE